MQNCRTMENSILKILESRIDMKGINSSVTMNIFKIILVYILCIAPLSSFIWMIDTELQHKNFQNHVILCLSIKSFFLYGKNSNSQKH